VGFLTDIGDFLREGANQAKSAWAAEHSVWPSSQSEREGVMNDAQLDEAAAHRDRLTREMFEERALSWTFFGFYLHDRSTDLENDEVLGRCSAGRGGYAVELVWNDELDLDHRGDGQVSTYRPPIDAKLAADPPAPPADFIKCSNLLNNLRLHHRGLRGPDRSLVVHS
jgi:hypothetical protein